MIYVNLIYKMLIFLNQFEICNQLGISFLLHWQNISSVFLNVSFLSGTTDFLVVGVFLDVFELGALIVALFRSSHWWCSLKKLFLEI